MARYIVTGDNHLLLPVPLCRKQEPAEWLHTQKAQLDFIVDMANTYNAELVITGDLFNSPKVPPIIVSMFLDSVSILQNKVHIIAGNHALPNHREADVQEASIGILRVVNNEKIEYHDCEEAVENNRFEHYAYLDEMEKDILLIHTLTFPTREIPFGMNGVSAFDLLQKYPEPIWIFTGDMHHHFHVEENNRFVINPGSMNIQTVGEMDYEHGVYFVDTGNKINVTTQIDKRPVYRVSEHKIEFIPIPDNLSIISREHIEKKKERDARISAFVETIRNSGQIGLSFEENLEQFLQQKNLSTDLLTVFAELKGEIYGH